MRLKTAINLILYNEMGSNITLQKTWQQSRAGQTNPDHR
jgi:hypothetical protein